MSAPADTGSSSLASTPAPSASTQALAGASTPSSTTTKSATDRGASDGAERRPRIDPHTTWEQLRTGKGDAKPEEPKVTPDTLKAYLDERKRERAEVSEDPEAGDAKAQTARAVDDVQKVAAEATANKQPDPEPEQAKPPRTFKVKVRGEETDVPLEKFAALVKLSPKAVEYIAETEGEQAAQQLYQRLHRGDEDARQHGTLRKQMDRLFAGLKDKPLDVLEYLASREDVGLDLLKLGYDIVERDIDSKAMTPEAKRLAVVEKQLKAYEMRDARDASERERVLRETHATAERNRVQTFVTQLGEEMDAALAEAGLPSDEYHRGLVESMMKADMARQGDAYRAPAIGDRAEMRRRAAAHIPAVRAQLKAALKALYGSADPATVKEFIAELPELHTAAAKERVAAFKKNSSAQTQGRAGAADNERGAPPTQMGKPKTYEEWRENLRRRA